MATQRLTVATLAGQAAVAVAARFDRWRTTPDLAAVDELCAAVRDNALSLPVVYFTEWVDRWLMGNLVPGPGAVVGRRFQATALTPEQALAWADQCGTQFAEQGWLAARLREAAACQVTAVEQYTVVVIRETLGPSVSDDEIAATLNSVPPWLVFDD